MTVLTDISGGESVFRDACSSISSWQRSQQEQSRGSFITQQFREAIDIFKSNKAPFLMQFKWTRDLLNNTVLWCNQRPPVHEIIRIHCIHRNNPRSPLRWWCLLQSFAPSVMMMVGSTDLGSWYNSFIRTGNRGSRYSLDWRFLWGLSISVISPIAQSSQSSLYVRYSLPVTQLPTVHEHEFSLNTFPWCTFARTGSISQTIASAASVPLKGNT
jgi:hypothetical protein